jgi:hypothetical protein
MAPEVAAERGVVVGQPYTPPGRTGTFDVPSYDDIADLQVLFKRFANTAASFTEAGGGPFVDKTGDFTVDKSGLYKTYLCLSSTLMTVTVPDPATLTDGDRFNLIQGGTGKAEISGTNVVGLSQTAGQYQGVTATVHDGKWWCVPFGSSGGGATGPIPVFPLAESVTVDVTQAGGLLAMDSTLGNLQVTIPQSSEIPVGSAYVVSNVGDSTKNRVTIKGDSGVTILNRAGAVVERWRMASIVKQEDGSTTNGNDVWLLNAGGGGSGGSAPLPPKLTLAAGGPECAYLNWVAPEDDGGHDLTTYTVERSTNGTDWALCATELPTVTSTRVDNLTTGTKYEFRVKAGNVIGLSDPSNVLEATPTNAYNDATGGTITTYTKDGRTYRVHTFTNNGTFSVTKSVVPFECLVVAGGGGGCIGESGGWNGSGGGAGGLLYSKSQQLTAGPYEVKVGSGGAGVNSPGGRGGQGGPSSLGNVLSATGGGGGGTHSGGGDGGSGGGSSYATGGKGIPGQGNNGVSAGGRDAPSYGGGAGGTPAGRSIDITGSAVTYATGGWGAPAGYGNGGNANYSSGDAGNSGIVVVAYEIAPSNDVEGGETSVYSKDGKFYRVHTFKTSAPMKVNNSSKPFRVVIVGGGGGSGCGKEGGDGSGRGGSGYHYTNDNLLLETGTYAVTVGGRGGGNKQRTGCGVPSIGGTGGKSSIERVSEVNGGTGGGNSGTGGYINCGAVQEGVGGPSFASDITGVSVTYAIVAGTIYGSGGTPEGGDGVGGVVLLSYEIPAPTETEVMMSLSEWQRMQEETEKPVVKRSRKKADE